MLRSTIVAAIAGVFAAGSALGAIVLTPAAWSAAPGGEMLIGVEQRTADGYRAIAWPQDDVEWMYVRGGARAWNLQRPAATEGESRAVPVAALGATVVGVQLAPRIERVDAGQLADVLVREGACDAAEAAEVAARLLKDAGVGDGPVRVKVVACAQAVIRAAEGVSENVSSPVALLKAGLVSEIRLLMDPIAHVAPTDIGVRLYAGSDSRKGVRVRATNLTTGEGVEETTGDGGIAMLPLGERGVWRVEFAIAETAAEDAEADVVIWSCSLGFEMTRVEEGE